MKTYTLSKWNKGSDKTEKLATGSWEEMLEEKKKLYQALVANKNCHCVHWDVSGVVWEENGNELLAFIGY